MHAEYNAAGKEDLRSTVQFVIVGPSFQHDQTFLNLFRKYCEHNGNNRDGSERTKYAPNCSYHGRNSRMSVEQLTQSTDLMETVDEIEADVVGILLNRFGENTLQTFREWHSKVKQALTTPAGVSSVLILPHGGGGMVSVCSGENVELYLRQGNASNDSNSMHKLFIPVLSLDKDANGMQSDTERLYSFLWRMGMVHILNQYIL